MDHFSGPKRGVDQTVLQSIYKNILLQKLSHVPHQYQYKYCLTARCDMPLGLCSVRHVSHSRGVGMTGAYCRLYFLPQGPSSCDPRKALQKENPTKGWCATERRAGSVSIGLEANPFWPEAVREELALRAARPAELGTALEATLQPLGEGRKGGGHEVEAPPALAVGFG